MKIILMEKKMQTITKYFEDVELMDNFIRNYLTILKNEKININIEIFSYDKDNPSRIKYKVIVKNEKSERDT